VLHVAVSNHCTRQQAAAILTVALSWTAIRIPLTFSELPCVPVRDLRDEHDDTNTNSTEDHTGAGSPNGRLPLLVPLLLEGLYGLYESLLHNTGLASTSFVAYRLVHCARIHNYPQVSTLPTYSLQIHLANDTAR
jgi:hypothetical protein